MDRLSHPVKKSFLYNCQIRSNIYPKSVVNIFQAIAFVTSLNPQIITVNLFQLFMPSTNIQ